MSPAEEGDKASQIQDRLGPRVVDQIAMKVTSGDGLWLQGTHPELQVALERSLSLKTFEVSQMQTEAFTELPPSG